MRNIALTGLCAVVVGGCGGGGGAPDIDTSQDNVCTVMAEVACFNMYQCCAEGEIEELLGVDEPRTEDQCVDDLERICERDLAILDWSITEGRASFDADIMNACLQELLVPETGECAVVADVLPWAEACAESAWIGLVADGSTCYYAYECAGADSYCASNRVCTARPGDGQPCNSGIGCATGLYCDVGTCAPLLGVGDPCSGGVCDVGLYCDYDALPEPVCAALRPSGDACTGDAMCESNQCLPGICAGTSSYCYTDDDCYGRCADDNSFCYDDGDCGYGTCSISVTICYDDFDCTGGVGDVCEFPIACELATCVGDPTCTDSFFTVDYCEDALGDLPLP